MKTEKSEADHLEQVGVMTAEIKRLYPEATAEWIIQLFSTFRNDRELTNFIQELKQLERSTPLGIQLTAASVCEQSDD